MPESNFDTFRRRDTIATESEATPEAAPVTPSTLAVGPGAFVWGPRCLHGGRPLEHVRGSDLQRAIVDELHAPLNLAGTTGRSFIEEAWAAAAITSPLRAHFQEMVTEPAIVFDADEHGAITFAPRNGIPIPGPRAPTEDLEDAIVASLTGRITLDPKPEKPAKGTRPSAELQAPLTYRVLHERRVAFFLEVIKPRLDAMVTVKHVAHRSTVREHRGLELSLDLPGYFTVREEDRNSCASESYREDYEADGVTLVIRIMDWSGEARADLGMPGITARDKRVAPTLIMSGVDDQQGNDTLADAIGLTPSDGPITHGDQLSPGVYASMISHSAHIHQISVDDPLWHLREIARVVSGDYMELPLECLNALDPAKASWLFPHLPMKAGNAGMVAFTQSPAAGQLDRQQVMKAGKFFKQYGHAHLNDEQIKQLAAVVKGSAPFTVKLGADRATLRRVYGKGPESCMCKGSHQGNKNKFEHTIVDGEWVHPIEVYAHPQSNLRLAFAESSQGLIGARVWVNTANKQHSTLYSTNNVRGALRFLEAWLEDEGYKSNQNWCEGEPLLRLDSDGGGIICPYLDPSNYGVTVESDRLVLGGGYEANHETGHLSEFSPDEEEEYDWHCACCGEGHDDSDDRYETVDGEDIGDCCTSDYTEVYSTDDGRPVWIRDRQLNRYQLYSTNYLSNRQFDHNGCNQLLAADGLPDELVELDSDEYGDNEVAARDACVITTSGEWVLEEDTDRRNLFCLADSNEWAPKDELVILVDADGTHELQFFPLTPAQVQDFQPTELDGDDFTSGADGIEVRAHQDFLDAQEDAA